MSGVLWRIKDCWEDFGYRLCWRGDWIGDIWPLIWHRWYCPYPVVIGNNSAKACVKAGYCGCGKAVHPTETEARE
ncbi:hypothetical protein [Bradyrhizobium sp. Leo121]|uniref:hypothetical protein n=1 Tax=Bradyrhizobium sp. Leo121 TaxID=1571195 RepID=UPI00102A4C21|nr:hypothetical protein [Bradyrhizobium sp. Leo121]RZN19508.1 hypothetical protein CWO90_35345 [Bradyrhizobium sp. Leo121]